MKMTRRGFLGALGATGASTLTTRVVGAGRHGLVRQDDLIAAQDVAYWATPWTLSKKFGAYVVGGIEGLHVMAQALWVATDGRQMHSRYRETVLTGRGDGVYCRDELVLTVNDVVADGRVVVWMRTATLLVPLAFTEVQVGDGSIGTITIATTNPIATIGT